MTLSNTIPWFIAGLFLVLSGCAGRPVPVAPNATAVAAVRAADEVGAERDARAALHLRLAREQLGLARSLSRDGDQDRAALMFRRARMDAELALAITRESTASTEARNARARARTMESSAQ